MFNGIWLVASESLMLEGLEVEPGERFQIPRTLAGAYLVRRQATIAPKVDPQPEPVPEAPTPRRRRPRKTTTATISAETPEQSSDESPRHYHRRDLEAEE